MVDSGCPVTALDSSMAKGLKSPSELGVVLDDPVLGATSNINHLVVLIDKLKLGKVEFKMQPAVSNTLEMDFVSTRYRCLIGLDFLTRNFCILDCPGRRLYIRGGKPSDEISNAFAKSLLLSGLTNVPMRWDGYGHLLVDAQINGQPVPLLVDTGCGISVLDQAEMNRLGLRPVTREKIGSYIPDDDFNAKVSGVGKIGGHKLHFTKVDMLQIGETQWKGLYMGTTDLSAWKIMDKQGKKRLHGALGPGTLAPEGVVIDFATRKLWFPKEESPALRSSRDQMAGWRK